MKAAEAGNRNIVVALLRAGCNPFLEDVQGRTADMYAESNHPNMDIHFILREYMEEIRSGLLEDPDQSVTAGGPQEAPTTTGGQEPPATTQDGEQDSNQIMENP